MKNYQEIEIEEVTFKVAEYSHRFNISAHHKVLDLSASFSIHKIEPRLVTQSQLLESKEFLQAKVTLVGRINSRMNELIELLSNRRVNKTQIEMELK